ncbi:MAG: hypothetical protein GTN84_14105 [Hydrogenophaga sp.]|uniref:hypothetical protein n=1 Tax=Hydrogenophaga sp. TaxID=1904254 RepID=UPI0016A649C4|nr:hypothetical protein [Hydrogenophaga sp.]NIM40169.1 hypothetical protein [Hydrogenophaga sp.]NIN25403.1 hypothetical protein [Hydrogenophaga sp.]NIN32260.1 hypothetical protein [Hydrogenophaga sp.]NIN56509.1 hypothetical protein [Hydrogenophaga sp.]NIO52818.1 hypothetical protein [Hydrogenophaga sp.]
MHLSAFSRRGKLTDRMLSKAVLAPIACGHAPPAALVEHLGLQHDVPRFLELFHLHGGVAMGGLPKYMAFYQAIKPHFPDSFGWRVTQTGGKTQVLFDKPYINFVRPSLLTLLTCCVRGHTHTTPALMARYPSLRGMPQALVRDLERLLAALSFHLPDDEFIAAVADVLLKGLNGEEVTLVSPVCPDYGYVPCKGGFRYTFDGLGDGVGLVAGRVVGVLPRLQDLLARHGIRSRIVIAAGDFEGMDEATVSRVGETRGSFRDKLERSQRRVLQALQRPAASVFIAELAGGEAAWKAMVDAAHHSLSGDDFDALMPTRVNLAQVLDARMPLYQAWHEGRSRSELADVLLRQGAEYAAMGRLFHRHFPHALVVGGDHNRMMPFYWLYQRIPVLYLKRVY